MRPAACSDQYGAAKLAVLVAAAPPTTHANAESCHLSPKQVVTHFMTELYVDKKVREAFETWVDPGYIQHNLMAQSGATRRSASSNPFSRSTRTSIIRSSGSSRTAIWSRCIPMAGSRPDDRGIAVVDILRVEGCKVVEHWDVVQPVPEKSANSNGMF